MKEIRRGLRGGEIEPTLASRILIYSYSKVFGISPMEAYNTPATIILEMMKIHTEVEEMKSQEIDRQIKKVR